MLVYYLYYIPLTFFAFKSFEIENKNYYNFIKLTFLIFIVLLVSLRDGLGGDNWTYLNKFRFFNINDIIIDPTKNIGFDLLNLFSKSIIDSIFFLYFLIILFNLSIFYYFINYLKIKNFFLIYLIVFFEFTILLNMGYLKQGIALSFVFLAIISIKKNNLLLFLLLIGFGVFFHKSIVFLFIFLPCFFNKKNYFIILLISLFLLGFFVSVFGSELERLYFYYLGEGNYFSSRGALLRIFFNTPFMLIFLFLLYNGFIDNEKELYLYFYVLFFLIIILLLFLGFSTFADRLNFYIIPFKIIIVSKLFEKIKISSNALFLKNMLIIKSLLIFFLWAGFSEYASAWSYSFFPLTCRSCQ